MGQLRRLITVCDGAGLTGGTEKVAITTAIGAAKRGIPGHFFAGEGDLYPGFESHLELKTTSLGLKDAYHEASKVELLKRFFWNPPAGEAFRRVLAEYSPTDTIVHVHGFRRVLSGSVIKAAKKLGFRVVFTLHDFGLVCPNTSLYQFPAQKICRLRPLSASCLCTQCTHSGLPMKLMQSGRGLALQVARVRNDFDGYLYVSEFSQRILSQHIPTERPSMVLSNPATDRQEPAADPAQSETFTYIGRLSPEKGVRLLAEAAKLAGKPVRFVGSGPEAEAIQAIHPDAELCGWCSPQQVADYIRQSRAVVLPSLWYETAGLSVLEAISRGIPAIVTDTCAATEYVQHSINGFHFENGNVKDLANYLSLLDPSTASKFGETGYRNYWQNPLSEDRYFDQLLPFYEQILTN